MGVLLLDVPSPALYLATKNQPLEVFPERYPTESLSIGTLQWPKFSKNICDPCEPWICASVAEYITASGTPPLTYGIPPPLPAFLSQSRLFLSYPLNVSCVDLVPGGKNCGNGNTTFDGLGLRVAIYKIQNLHDPYHNGNTTFVGICLRCTSCKTQKSHDRYCNGNTTFGGTVLRV